MANRASILIVEDDPNAVQLLADMLRLADYPIIRAEDGVQAIDHLDAAAERVGSIGLVILDMLMPGITGMGVLRHLAQHPGAPPVLVISGSTVALEAARDFGVQATLKKPFRVDELLELVARLCPVA